MNISEELLAARDEGYRDFAARLVPSLPKERILGVRTPVLRRLARALSKDESEAFLRQLPHRCLEENLLHFFLLEQIRDFDACAAAVEEFLPFVDCWPVSDQATPRCFRKNHARLLPLLRKWLR